MLLTSVDGGTSVLEFEFFTAKFDLFKLDLPVSLAANGNIVDLASVMAGVDATENCFSTICIGIAQSESKDRFVEELLVDHVVEGGCDVVDSNCVIRKTQDAIESTSVMVSVLQHATGLGDLLAKSKGQTRLLDSLCKLLPFDSEIPNAEIVLRDETLEGARNIGYFEF